MGMSISIMIDQYGIWYIDMVIYYIDMVILNIDMGHGLLMIWEMTVSIRYVPNRYGISCHSAFVAAAFWAASTATAAA